MYRISAPFEESGQAAIACENDSRGLFSRVGGFVIGHGNRMAAVADLPPKKAKKLLGWPGVEPGRPFGLQIFAPLWLSPPPRAFVVRTVP
jgi:hypothetical protein